MFLLRTSLRQDDTYFTSQPLKTADWDEIRATKQQEQAHHEEGWGLDWKKVALFIIKTAVIDKQTQGSGLITHACPCSRYMEDS